MMRYCQRAASSPMARVALAWSLGVAALLAQPGADAPADKGTKQAARVESFTMRRDARIRKRLDAAQDFLAEGSWADAIHVLHVSLRNAEDGFVEVTTKDKDGRETKKLASARAEALRLLDSMPAKGREEYQAQMQEKASAALTEAKKAGGPDALSDVLRSYPRTPVAAEAAELLAVPYLDKAPEFAWLYLDSVLGGVWEPPPVSLVYRAAIVQRRLGRAEAAAAIEKQLFERLGKEAFGVDGKNLSADDIRKELAAVKAVEAKAPADWPLFRGDARRDATSRGDVPFLDEDAKKWSHPTIRQEATKTWVDQAIKFQEERQRAPVLPAFFPIAAKGRVIFRSYFGVHGVNLRNGKLEWEQDSDYSFDNLVNPQRSAGKLLQLNQWIPMYKAAGRMNLAYENSSLGTLSTDQERVYMVDDLALPPDPLMFLEADEKPKFGVLTDAVLHNRLLAMDLDSGKRRWQAGGRGAKAGPLGDSFFLGAPLPLHGRLYVLNEKEAELRLVCLNAADGKFVWAQGLGSVDDALPRHPTRRFQAAPLAFADGILVCPTNSGVVFGFDLVRRSLAWTYSYDRPAAPAPRGARPIPPPIADQLWKYATPCIEGGKVVFTAPDGSHLHCLNLRDGSSVWKSPRQGDAYLAGVFNGKVLIVGSKSCRALALTDGKLLWNAETGMPSGLGVCTGDRYLLPLRFRVGSDAPEICVLDLNKGEVVAHVRGRRPEPVGNLLLFEGRVISQTARHITAYPELAVKRGEMDKLLALNPKDAAGLFTRAELRYAAADPRGAAEDLITALDQKPAAEIRAAANQKLFEVLTDLLHRDFSGGEKYLDRYKAACTVPIPEDARPSLRASLALEQKKREAGYFALVAAGCEQQGKVDEALSYYLEFSKVAVPLKLLSSPDEPAVQASPVVWASGRIAAMMERATPENRKLLDDAIAARAQAVRAGKSLDDLRNFVALFGSVSAGHEARLELATRLIDQKVWQKVCLEAETHLMLLRGAEPKVAARAVEFLARLMLQKEIMDDASHWYRTLGRDFDKVAVRDGKTGGDLFRDVTTDKRFLPFLEGPADPWKDARFKHREEFGNFQQANPVYIFEPEGEPLPSMLRKRFAYATNTAHLKVADRKTGEELWNQGLTRQNPQFLQYLNWNQYHPSAAPVKFPYGVRGHVVVFSLGVMVYGLDLLEQRILWERSLLGDKTADITRLEPSPGGGLQAVHVDDSRQALGGARFVSLECVVVQSSEGLIAVDPLTGAVRWQRGDVPPRTRIFGDAVYLYLIDVGMDGAVGKSRALRTRDGVAVKIPDFSAIYPLQGARTVGRHLLLNEKGAKEQNILRLYDAHTGKDIWKQEFKKGAVVLNSEEPGLVGVVEPENDDKGKVTIFDLLTKKERYAGSLDLKTLEKARDGSLLADRDHFYVTITGPNAERNPWGGPWPNLVNGCRGLPLNGRLFALPRNAETKKWWCDAQDQVLLQNPHENLPILLLSARTQQMRKGSVIQTVKTMAIDKRSGKVLYDKQMENNNTNFHTLHVDVKNRTVALIGYNMKLEFFVEK